KPAKGAFLEGTMATTLHQPAHHTRSFTLNSPVRAAGHDDLPDGTGATAKTWMVAAAVVVTIVVLVAGAAMVNGRAHSAAQSARHRTAVVRSQLARARRDLAERDRSVAQLQEQVAQLQQRQQGLDAQKQALDQREQALAGKTGPADPQPGAESTGPTPAPTKAAGATSFSDGAH